MDADVGFERHSLACRVTLALGSGRKWGVLLLPSFVPLLVLLFSLALSLSLLVPPSVVLLVFVTPHVVFQVLTVDGVRPVVRIIRCFHPVVHILVGQSLGCLRHLVPGPFLRCCLESERAEGSCCRRRCREFCSRVVIECPIEDAFVDRIQNEQIVY